MILILILAPQTLGARGTCPHLPSPSCWGVANFQPKDQESIKNRRH